MTDTAREHRKRGQAAYDRGELVLALRWWLKAADEGSISSLEDALKLCESPTGGRADPWIGILRSVEALSGGAAAAVDPPQWNADWSQFGPVPQQDQAIVNHFDPEHGLVDPPSGEEDGDWRRLVDVLEQAAMNFAALFRTASGSYWTGEHDTSVLVLFGVEPPSRRPRHFRVHAPLLLGLPDDTSPPNLAPDADVAQAAFGIPLRPAQELLIRACLLREDNEAWTASDGAIPDLHRPTPRVSAGMTNWTVGRGNLPRRLLLPVPQVSIGYEIDVSLSGPRLLAAVQMATESVVRTAGRISAAYAASPATFCEFFPCVAFASVPDAWAETYEVSAYPDVATAALAWADDGGVQGMHQVACDLEGVEGFEAQCLWWLDQAISAGYPPSLALKTWLLTCRESFAESTAAWRDGESACRRFLSSLDDDKRQQVAPLLLDAEANAAVAALALTGDLARAEHAWQRLSEQGHLESRIYPHVARILSAHTSGPEALAGEARDMISNHPGGDWVTSARFTFADGIIASRGWAREWFRQCWRMSQQYGLPMECRDEDEMARARTQAYVLIQSGDEEIGELLQEASTLAGWPYAGADHSWRMLSAGRYEEAVSLFEMASPQVLKLMEQIPPEEAQLRDSWRHEWANYRSNVALCRLALGGPIDEAVLVWNEGATTGHVESMFYPAVAAARGGDAARASQILAAMPGESRADMIRTALQGSRSETAFWRDWSLDGLRVLGVGDPTPPSPASATGLLGTAKKPRGLLGQPSETASDARHGSAVDPGDEFRFCPSCGTPRAPQGRFCGACGFGYP